MKPDPDAQLAVTAYKLRQRATEAVDHILAQNDRFAADVYLREVLFDVYLQGKADARDQFAAAAAERRAARPFLLRRIRP